MSHEVFTYGPLPLAMQGYQFLDHYRVGLLPRQPAMDGPVQEAEWRQAAVFDGLSYIGSMEQRRARVYVGATATHFCIAIVTELPPGAALVAEKAASSDIVWDDAIEVWLDPSPGTDSGVAFQLLANSKGTASYIAHPRGDVPAADYFTWRGDYAIHNTLHEGFWHCLIAVPLARVAPGRKITDGRWGINVCRDWKNPWGFSSLGNRGYAPADEIVFTFAEKDCLAVEVQHATDPTTRDIDVSCLLRNNANVPMQAVAQLLLRRDKMPDILEEHPLTIAPHQTARARLAVQDRVTDKFELFVLVRREPACTGDEAFHYTRFYRWGEPRAARWDIQKRPKLPLDFRFAYYPYLNKLRVQADLTGLPADRSVDRVEFVVRPAGSSQPLASFTCVASQFRDGLCETELTLDPLAGNYEIVAIPHGVNPPEPLVKPFERRVYEWEHNTLGRSRKVYPPFEPIRVEGSVLHVAMRDYHMDDTGLPAKIIADDQQGLARQNLLARPIQYRACIDGKWHTATEGSVRLASAADDLTVLAGRFHVGALQASAKSTLEYDGMLRVDLTLENSGGKTLEALDLDIPLRAPLARYMHAMAAGIRHTIWTSPLPEGQGTVWTASKLAPSDAAPNFCTYLFVGDAARGLCWFAENDRGWSWDPATPNLEIIRTGDEVLLRVHLVNKPLRFDTPRTLTFGLMGAPVKPRLAGWRHRWFTDRFSVIGTDIHWFALGSCASVYPAGKDMFFWEAIRRAVQHPLSEAQVQEVIDRARPHFEPYGEALMEYVRTLAHRTLTQRAGTLPILYYNRASYPVAEEYQTFMDEWGLEPYCSHRGSRSRWEVKIAPCDSYNDFAMHWYVKSFEIAGNRGIYVDNIWFCPSANTLMTDAYRRDDGTFMPSTGIWGLRDLCKRQFVLLNERGMEPFNMVHMTSTQILPLNSWYTIQYDWELRFSEGDVHTRFPRDYLLTLSSGEHAGAWPIVLHEQGRCVEDPWIFKTFLAVSLVHELIVDPYVWDVAPVPPGDTPENRLAETFRAPLLKMAQEPDLQVYRYWDDRPQPVRADDPDLPTIVYSLKGRQALWAITNYGPTKTAAIRIDPAPLGFPNGYRMTDVETGQDIPVHNHQASIEIRRHDLREFRIVPL